MHKNKTKYNLETDRISGLICKNKADFISLDLQKERYLKHNNKRIDSDYMAYQKKIWSQFISKFMLMPDVLDYGCGEEAPLKYISGSDMDLYDLFFYPDASVFSKQYNTIILIEVVEHFESPIETFKLLNQMLKPNGRLIIQTEFIPKDKPIQTWWYLRDETHVCFYDLNVFKYLSNHLGLEIIYTNHKNRIVLQKTMNKG